jgi:hypothetical protein
MFSRKNSPIHIRASRKHCQTDPLGLSCYVVFLDVPGKQKTEIFSDDLDRVKFLEIPAKSVELFQH